MNALEARALDDEAIDAFLAAGDFGQANVMNEAARRAEIRVNRAFDGMPISEIYVKHDASWYESRQTEEQFLDEMGVAR